MRNATYNPYGTKEQRIPDGLTDETVTQGEGKGLTWGDTMLALPHKRTRIEPCLIPQILQRDGDVHEGIADAYITGELLTERYTRGNLLAIDRDTGETRRLHPFAGSNRSPKAGASQYLKLDAPRRPDTEFLG